MAQNSIIFAGTSHVSLAKDVAGCLKMELGKISIETFPDGEIGVQILENVRGKDVFVIQSLARDPNRFLMELLVIVDACKRASARSIVAVIPYFAYARQDRKEKGRVPITARLVANMLERAGVSRVLTMDLHAEQIQGFFDIPLDHLLARPLFVKELKKVLSDSMVVLAPDLGANKLARRFAEDLGVGFALIDKRRTSPSLVAMNAIIGNVSGMDVVIVDDICSTGATLELAAKVCKKAGAKKIIAAVTHAVLVGKEKLVGIDELYVTDSTPPREGVKVVTIAPLIAKAIDCVISAKSMSSLF